MFKTVMKRGLILGLIILALCLAVPFCVSAESQDPLVGYWYAYIDLKAYPELIPTFGDYDHMLSMYYFDPSGVVYLLENDVKDGASTPYFCSSGKWEKAESGYNVSIIGLGETTLSFYGPNAFLQIPGSPLSMKLRNITVFNPYKDYSNNTK